MEKSITNVEPSHPSSDLNRGKQQEIPNALIVVMPLSVNVQIVGDIAAISGIETVYVVLKDDGLWLDLPLRQGFSIAQIEEELSLIAQRYE